MDQSERRPEDPHRDMFRRLGDEIRRNGRIIRTRFDIAGISRRRDRLYRDLGLRVYRLCRLKKLDIPDVAHLVASLHAVEVQLDQKEKELRAAIVGSEPAGAAAPGPPPAEKAEPPKAAEPEPPPPKPVEKAEPKPRPPAKGPKKEK